MNPKIYLGIDNCFASKRWVRPAEWMRVIRDLGIRYIEASADTECDPLYLGEDFIRQWLDEVRAQEAALDMKVKNVYSGHGTYVTTGIAHYDKGARKHFLDRWVKRQMDTAQALGAGFGFFAHGFEETALQNADYYEQKLEDLYDSLAELAGYAAEIGMDYAGVEQMYSPHQPPWTIKDTKALLKEVYRRSGQPFYITADLGHMNGQQFFPWPDEEDILNKIAAARAGKPVRRAWFGTIKARGYFLDAVQGKLDEKETVERILADAAANPRLFARPEDWSIDAWVRELGCYSPILHLQQSDGKSSPHWPFSREFNEKGVVEPEKVLRALAESFAAEAGDGMPPKCGEVVFTLEPFIGTAGSTYDLLDDLKKSVAYWRQWIPRDGMYLSEIMERL